MGPHRSKPLLPAPGASLPVQPGCGIPSGIRPDARVARCQGWKRQCAFGPYTNRRGSGHRPARIARGPAGRQNAGAVGSKGRRTVRRASGKEVTTSPTGTKSSGIMRISRICQSASPRQASSRRLRRLANAAVPVHEGAANRNSDINSSVGQGSRGRCRATGRSRAVAIDGTV